MFPIGSAGDYRIEDLEEYATQAHKFLPAKTTDLHCNGFGPGSGNREAVVDMLRNNGFGCQMDKGGKTGQSKDLWMKDVGQSFFALSPAGAGLSCHRTWEIWLVGSIPVIDYHPEMTSLYEGLPYLAVSNGTWDTITPEFLASAKARLLSEARAGKYSIEKLYASYWLRTVLSAMQL